MLVKRATIEIKINLDPVPGWNHEPEDMVKHLQESYQLGIILKLNW